MADRELQKGDLLVCTVKNSGCQVGDVLKVKGVKLKWPCQNFVAEGHSNYEFAHQQFDHAKFQVGDVVECTRSSGYASIQYGEKGIVSGMKDAESLILRTTAFGGWHDVKDFKLTRRPNKMHNMSEEEWENNEGWINEATHHAAMCLYNDRKGVETLDAKLLSKKGLVSVYSLLSFVNLPEGLSREDVDVWSLQYNRLIELKEQGVISNADYDEILKRFTSKHSGTCSRRLDILKKEGFETEDHFFDDYRRKEQEMSINPFKVGDKVMLVDNYMDVDDSRTEDNCYAQKNSLKEGDVYKVLKAGENSIKVNEGGWWMNPRQFQKVADVATFPDMSKEDTMKKLQIEKIVYVNGTNVEDYDANAQATMVEKYEAEIARLEAFATKPKKVVALIAEMKADLAEVVAAFDAVED